MTMENDFERLKAFHERGALVQDEWGDAVEQACLMSALTGATSIDGCTAKGWPKWLAELGTVIFDNTPEDEAFDRAEAFHYAVKAAEARGADWDRVFRDIRLTAILPIAMEAIGEGEEPWRVKCRKAVQWSIDHDGQVCPDEMVAGAVKAARAAGADDAAYAARAVWAAGAADAALAARAAGAADAALAAWAAGAADAALAAWAAGAAGAADAHTRIFHATIAALRGGLDCEVTR